MATEKDTAMGNLEVLNDVFSDKFWKNCEVRIAYVGMENETEPEDDMPFRTIGYDRAKSIYEALQDTRFEEVYIEAEKGDESKTMSEVLDRVEKRGEKRGEERGRKAGQMEITRLRDLHGRRFRSFFIH